MRETVLSTRTIMLLTKEPTVHLLTIIHCYLFMPLLNVDPKVLNFGSSKPRVRGSCGPLDLFLVLCACIPTTVYGCMSALCMAVHEHHVWLYMSTIYGSHTSMHYSVC